MPVSLEGEANEKVELTGERAGLEDFAQGFDAIAGTEEGERQAWAYRRRETLPVHAEVNLSGGSQPEIALGVSHVGPDPRGHLGSDLETQAASPFKPASFEETKVQLAPIDSVFTCL